MCEQAAQHLVQKSLDQDIAAAAGVHSERKQNIEIQKKTNKTRKSREVTIIIIF